MLTVGDKFPEFELTACVSLEKGKEFEQIHHKSYEGKWLVVFAWREDGWWRRTDEIYEPVRVGEAVGLVFRSERLSLFDAGSGTAVRTARQVRAGHG